MVICQEKREIKISRLWCLFRQEDSKFYRFVGGVTDKQGARENLHQKQQATGQNPEYYVEAGDVRHFSFIASQLESRRANFSDRFPTFIKVLLQCSEEPFLVVIPEPKSGRYFTTDSRAVPGITCIPSPNEIFGFH